MKFIETLDKELEKRGWSRVYLAERAAVNVNTLQGYWKFKRIPRGDDLVKIALALDVTPEYLLLGSNPPSVTNEIVEWLKDISPEERLEIKSIILEYFKNKDDRRKQLNSLRSK